MRFSQAQGDDDALASGQPIRLDDDRRALLVDVGVRSRSLGEAGKARGRNVVPDHEALGEVLRTLELSGLPGRPENLQAASAKKVDDARRKRRFRADDRQLDFLSGGKIGECFRVAEIDVFEFTLTRRAGVSRGDEDLLQPRSFCQTPGQCVFATAGTNDQ
jgi:hypothetical protein